MLTETDMQEVKRVYIELLGSDIEETEFSPDHVNHPIFESAVLPVRMPDGNPGQVNILENGAARDMIAGQYLEQFHYMKNPQSVMAFMIRRSWWMLFLEKVQKSLSMYDFGDCLGMAWIMMENPFSHTTEEKVYAMLHAATAEALMTEEELSVYNSLPEELTLYSADGFHWKKEPEGEGAAERTVSKENIIAYFNRNDSEEYLLEKE